MLILNMAGDVHLPARGLARVNVQVVKAVAMVHVWAAAKGTINFLLRDGLYARLCIVNL